MSFTTMLRKPSALLPIAMSAAALALVFVQLAVAGIARQADEGAAARLWQLLMAVQVPIVVFFVIWWLPRYPRQALAVAALQFIAALAALAPVFILGWQDGGSAGYRERLPYNLRWKSSRPDSQSGKISIPWKPK